MAARWNVSYIREQSAQDMGECVRKVAGWLCIGIVVLWIGAFLVLKASQDRVTAQMVSVADRLTVPAAWTLDSEVIESEKLVCLNGNPCPSLSRTWQTDRELQQIDLMILATAAGWIPEVDGDCIRRPDPIGTRSVCSATALDSGYEVRLRVDSPDAGSPSRLRLSLKPADN